MPHTAHMPANRPLVHHWHHYKSEHIHTFPVADHCLLPKLMLHQALMLILLQCYQVLMQSPTLLQNSQLYSSASALLHLLILIPVPHSHYSVALFPENSLPVKKFQVYNFQSVLSS